jgi:hypothetical protein
MDESKSTFMTLEAAYQRIQIFQEHARIQRVLAKVDLRVNNAYTSEFQEILGYMITMVQALRLGSDEMIDKLDEIQKDIDKNMKILSSVRTKSIYDNVVLVMRTISSTLYDLK